MASELWTLVKSEVDAFNQESGLDINPTYARRQKDIIELIDYYWMSKFRDGQMDSTGFRKTFFNIVENPSLIASKMIDLDTKDIRIIAEEGQSYYPAWFYGKDLKLWMKDRKNKDGKTFGQFLNELVSNWPRYGHLLLKKAKDTVYLVPLHNVICQQDAKDFLSSDLFIEEHDYTVYQLRRQGWDKVIVDRIINNRKGESTIKIYEVHGECDCMEGHNYHILPEKAEDDEILLHDTIDRDMLYKELKWEEVAGRALGRGNVEKLFENQIAKNANENLFRQGLRWTSKHIFQSRDQELAKNLITDIENGDILQVISEVTPIAVEERNLAAYNFADSKWDRNTSERSFSAQQALSGERPPAGTPLGTTIVNVQQASGYYDFKKEDLGLFLKQVIWDWILPEAKKHLDKKHKLMLGEFDEEEVSKLRGLVLTNRLNEAIVSFVEKNNYLPSAQEIQVLKSIEKRKLKTQKELEIPDSFYEDLKYKIDVLITNEQIDTASRMTTLQTIFQILGSNPSVLKDPRIRKVLYKLLDYAGINPVDLQVDEEEPELENEVGQMMAQRGGSIASAIPTPITATTALPTRL